MRKLSVLLLFLFSIVNAQTNINAGKVSGLWIVNHSPYIILGDIQIDSTKQLRIEPGVEVRFSGNYKLTVLGRLLVEGTITDSVKFTAADTSVGWGGIRFTDTDNNLLDSSKIMFASFSYGKTKTGTDEEKSGGAILIKNSSKLGIYNSYFYHNTSLAGYMYGGGAIFIDNSNCIIHNCNFYENYALNGNGGALYVYNSGINLRNSAFINNYTKSWGGAIFLKDNKGNLLRYLNIRGNSASNGGGIYIDKTLLSNDNFDISLIDLIENHARNWGGGLFLESKVNPELPLRNIRISKNTADRNGSAFAAFKEVVFQNCIIDHNNNGSSTYSVNPIYIMPLRMNFINCVIADNSGNKLIQSYGEEGEFGNIYITNSIIWHNESGIVLPNNGGYVYAAYSTIQYPWDGFTMGQGVNHKDPQFKNHTNGNYHLSYDSPAIDKGSEEEIFNDYILDPNAGLGTVRNDLGAYGGRLNAWRDSPIANFIAYNRHGEAPLTVQFKELALNDPLEFSWDFNNDGVYDSFDRNPTYTYETPGIYSVTLKVNSFEFVDTLTFHDYIVVRQNGLSGAVSGVWDLDTMRILGDIFIPEDSTLIIMPGTNVYFSGNYKFNVYGTLLAEGTEENKIFFYSDSLGEINTYPYYKGQWGGINFLNSQTTNQIPSALKNCSLRYGFETWIDELSNILGGGILLYKSKIYLENVTIDSCYANKGGGIYLNESILTANNLTVKDIKAIDGVYSFNSKLNIRNSFFKNNTGCGIYAENGNIYIANSVLDSNYNQYGNGSGLYASGSSVYILDSEFNYNHSGNAPGGGISISYAPEAVLEKVKVMHNFTSSAGGGIYFKGTNPVLKNIELAYNSSDFTGGGINFDNENNGIHRYANLDNCLIYKNETRTTYGTGAGITLGMNCHANITNTTFTENTSKDFAAIGNAWGTGIANVKNSIIYNNGTNYDLQVQGDYSVYNYSLIQGYYSGMDTSTTNLNNYDPAFVNSTEDNYHLNNIACSGFVNSPAIDTGDPNIKDFVLDCSAGLGAYRSDMGAYGGANNRWINSLMPECYFSGAVSGNWDCDNIIIEGDIYIPEGDTLTIKAGANITFNGNHKFEVFGVLNAKGTETDTITFTGDEEFGWGGIIFKNLDSTNTAESTIKYCKFENGNALYRNNETKNGGALNIIASSNITVEDCYFSYCKAYLGGAIYVEKSAPSIKYNRFENNTATGAGGAIYLDHFNEPMHRLEFVNNIANNGGAMFLSYSSPQITNVLAYSNTSLNSAAFAFLFNSSPYIINLTSVKNISNNNSGGSFSLMYNSNPDLLNSILYHNSPVDVYINDGTFNATFSLIENGSSQPYFGEGCLDTNPEFRSLDDNNYHLKYVLCGSTYNSPAIDAGYAHPSFFDTYLDCTAGLGTIRVDLGYYGGKYFKETVAVETEEPANVPKEYALEQNYPNPFNPSTTISFSLPFKSSVNLTIYDILGKQVETLINEEMNAGKYVKIWNAGKFASGVYFYKLNAGKFNVTKKMLLIK